LREGRLPYRQDNAQRVFARVPWPAACLVHASGTWRTQGVTHRLRLAGHSYGNVRAGRRSRHRLVPVSSGAKAPLACEDRKLVRVCSRVVSRLQKSASDVQVQRSVSPGGNGARVRGPSTSRVCKDSRDAKRAARIGIAAAKPRTRGSPEPGARKGVAGRRFLVRRKVSRIDPRLVSFTRASHGRSWRFPSRVYVVRAAGHGWRARQGCQRFGRHALRQERKAPYATKRKARGVRRSEPL
jgi:hypothetical protein